MKSAQASLSRIHIYYFCIPFISGALWLLFSGLTLIGPSGFDPYRFVELVSQCKSVVRPECNQNIITFLSLFADSKGSLYYFTWLFVAAIALTIPNKVSVLKPLIPCTPIMLLYIGQTGKDGWTILGSIASISLVLHYVQGKRKPIVHLSTWRQLICIAIISVGVILRPELLLFALVFFIFILLLEKKYIFSRFLSSYRRPRASIIMVGVILLFFAILNILFKDLIELDALRHEIKYSASDYSSSGIAKIITGTEFNSYILRSFLYPLIAIFKSSIDVTSCFISDCKINYITLKGLLTGIIALEWAFFSKKFPSLYLYLIPFAAIVGIFPYVHTRYLLVTFPFSYALATISLHTRD